jgi:sugar phosphate isomerase/epimerase
MAAVGRPIPSLHSEKRIGAALGSPDPEVRERGEARFRLNVDLAQALGAPLLNVHLWDLPESDCCLERNIATLQDWLPRAEAAGVQVALETTPCRLSNPLDNIVRALEELEDRCRVTLDVEFLAWHGCLERALEHPALGGEVVSNVHLRDYDGSPFDGSGRRRYVNPGDGELDLAGIVRRLLDRGYRGPFTFEGSCPSRPAEEGDLSEVNGYLAYIRRLLEAAVEGDS